VCYIEHDGDMCLVPFEKEIAVDTQVNGHAGPPRRLLDCLVRTLPKQDDPVSAIECAVLLVMVAFVIGSVLLLGSPYTQQTSQEPTT
jgi:hypothetical protein